MKKILEKFLIILSAISVLFGIYLGIESSNAGLAGIAVALLSIVFIVAPIIIWILIINWKIGISFILSSSLIIYLMVLMVKEPIIAYIGLGLIGIWYLYLLLVKKIYLKWVLVFIISFAILGIANIVTNKIHETEEKVSEIYSKLDQITLECIRNQEKYGTSLEMLPKICDMQYKVRVSKPACKYISEIEPWQFNQKVKTENDDKDYKFKRRLGYAKVISATINGQPFNKNSCKKDNEIKFRMVPFFRYTSYKPEQRNDVEYTTYNGRPVTRSEWVDLVWDKAVYQKSSEENYYHNEKELDRLLNNTNNNNNKDNGNYQIYTFNLD